jgi:hypothetical protein
LIQRLKTSLDETIHERDQSMRTTSNVHRKVCVTRNVRFSLRSRRLIFNKIEKLENDIDNYVKDNRQLQQTAQQFEKQLNTAHLHGETLQRSLQQNELSYQDKVIDMRRVTSTYDVVSIVSRSMNAKFYCDH